MKVKVSDISTSFFYPDVTVTCDPDDNDSEYYTSSPLIIVEVFRKSNDWKSSVYFIGDEITFESIINCCSIPSPIPFVTWPNLVQFQGVPCP